MLRSWTIGWLATAVALAATTLVGCASMKRSCIDPTGDHIFSPRPGEANAATGPAASGLYVDSPAGPFNYDDVETLLQRTDPIVAPVGSEVVLVAGVAGTDGYLRTNRRLEWSIAPGSVGNFVAVEEGTFTDIMLGDFTRPHLASNTFAVGSTGRSYLRLTRGTPTPDDDVFVMRGQGWVSLTSAVEGTSNVVVVSPDVYNWQTRTKTATVHWVDVVWRFPPPAINPAGTKHVFTTSVTRLSNQSPCEGWRVRYEITSGPPAGFSPDGSQVVEVPTNAAGQASVEIFQKQAVPGTNNVSIQVIRPSEAPGAGGQKLVVGNGTTMKTWTAADLSIAVAGPVTAVVGSPLTYRVNVTNPGDLPARDVVVTNSLPEGLTYLDSNPAAENAGRQLQWRLGEIGARQCRTIEVQFRPERGGVITNCCEASAAGGLKVSNCATTTIGTTAAPANEAAPPTIPPGANTRPGLPPTNAGQTLPPGTLTVQVIDPPQTQVPVGSDVTYKLVLTNRGTATLTGVQIRDRLDPGLYHSQADAEKGLAKGLGSLPGGQSVTVEVTLRVTQPGRLCQRIEVTSQQTAMVTAQACILGVVAAPPGGSQPTSGGWPGGTTSPPAGQPQRSPITVRKTGPTLPLKVGETARFSIEVTNNGAADIRGVKIADRYDSALQLDLATEGFGFENNALVWQKDLQAGKTVRFDVQCKCNAPANACSRATIILPDGRQIEDQACVEIRPTDTQPPPSRVDMNLPGQPTNPPRYPPTNPPSGQPSGQTSAQPSGPTAAGEPLSLSVIGLRNPVAVNKELSYIVRVTNTTQAAVKAVSVTATVPDGMDFVPLGTEMPNGSSYRRDGQVIRFDTVDSLAPGDSATYRIVIRTKQAGQFRLKVDVRAPDLTKTITGEASTDVF